VPPALLCTECARRPGRRGPPPTHLFCGLPGHGKPDEQTFLALLQGYIPGFASMRLSAPLAIHFTGRRARPPRRRARPPAPDAGPNRTLSALGLNPLAPAFVTAQPPVVPVFHPPDTIPAQLPRQPRQTPLSLVGPSRDGSGFPHAQPHASVVRRRGPHPSPGLSSGSCPPGSASCSSTPPAQPVPGPARQPKLQPSVPSQPVACGSAWGVCAVPRCRAQLCDEPLHRKGALRQPSFSLGWGTPEEDFFRVPAGA